MASYSFSLQVLHNLNAKIDYLKPVLRIRDVYPGSRIRLFSIPDPNFFHTGSASKNLSILTQKWFLSSRKYDPGCSSRIRMLTFYPSLIPGSKRHRIPDPQHCIKPVLRITDILVRIQGSRSVPLSNGRPKNHTDLTDPDADLEHWYIYIILQRCYKEVTKQ
jgi:hypothetical protein